MMTEIAELVERLREGIDYTGSITQVMAEGASALEQAHARIAELEGALIAIINTAPGGEVSEQCQLRMLEIASAALKEQ